MIHNNNFPSEKRPRMPTSTQIIRTSHLLCAMNAATASEGGVSVYKLLPLSTRASLPQDIADITLVLRLPDGQVVGRSQRSGQIRRLGGSVTCSGSHQTSYQVTPSDRCDNTSTWRDTCEARTPFWRNTHHQVLSPIMGGRGQNIRELNANDQVEYP